MRYFPRVKVNIIKIIFFCMTFLIGNESLSQKPDYAASAIPAALVENANVVKRMDNTLLIIHNPGKATLKKKYALTILNEAGDNYAEFVTGYNKLVKLTDTDGRLFNAAGIQVRSVKKKEMKDFSATGNDLMDENRVKTHNFYHKVYPYTIEYEIVEEYKGILNFETWQPQNEFAFSVESSKMEVRCPASYNLRYKAFQFDHEPLIVQNSSEKTYLWEIKNLPAIEHEYETPSWTNMTPTVYLAPSDFEMEDYEGKMDTWENFGKFIFQLNKGRDVLLPNIKSRVHEISDHLKDDRQKVGALYHFLQENTHYVSVQLGIGGWQPFSSEYVGVKGYGDCKALSNFMYAILKEAGIASYYSLVYADSHAGKTIENFPCSQFNHVILCVPHEKDTTWLECTSQILPAGYLGSFTGNRKALLVNENGGKLVSTPRYGANDNLQIRKISGQVTDAGDLSFDCHTTSFCEKQDDLQHLANESAEKQQEYLKAEIDLATYNVKRSDYKQSKSFRPSVIESLSIDAPNYATTMGKRLFITPNVLNRFAKKADLSHKRRFNVEIHDSYVDIDTVMLKIPEGYSLEALPEEVRLSTKFGKYECNTSIENNFIKYTRRFEQFGGTFPAGSYEELCAFYKTIYISDRKKVVLIK